MGDICAACGVRRQRSCFSKSQLAKKLPGARRCVSCVAAERPAAAAGSVDSVDFPATKDCPGKHGLTFTQAVDGQWCDVCGNEDLPVGSRLFGCMICNYDVCESCHRQAATLKEAGVLVYGGVRWCTLSVASGKAGFTCSDALRVIAVDVGGAAEAAGVVVGMLCKNFQNKRCTTWRALAAATQVEPQPWAFEFTAPAEGQLSPRERPPAEPAPVVSTSCALGEELPARAAAAAAPPPPAAAAAAAAAPAPAAPAPAAPAAPPPAATAAHPPGTPVLQGV